MPFPVKIPSLFGKRTQTTHQLRSIPEYIEVKDPATGKPVAFLSPDGDGLKDCYINNELNVNCTLEFYLPATSEKWAYLTDQYCIYAGGKEFVIANPDATGKTRDGEKLWGKVLAHESWTRALGKAYTDGISNASSTPSPPWSAVVIVSGGSDLSGGRYAVGSAGHALYALLQGTGWSVGTVDVAGIYDLETEKMNILENIQRVQEKWGGCLVWDSLKKTVSLRAESTWLTYTGFGVRYAKNLQSIERIDDWEIVTRLYPFGADDLNIAPVNGGLLYLDNNTYSSDILKGKWENQDIGNATQLKAKGTEYLAKMCKPRHQYKVKMLDLRTVPGYEHETFDVGHLIDIVDEELGINVQARIIRHKHNVFQPWLNELDVGDPMEKLATSIAHTIKSSNFIKNTVKPNASIQNLLKALLDTAATTINGASGDYTLVDGISTWAERVSGSLTGKLLRITPAGMIISSDGGQTWDLAIDGAGINAAMVNTGTLNAAIVNILSNNGKFKIEDKGLKIYDAGGVLRVHIGEYATGEYGVKIIGGKIYASTIRTGAEGATTYVGLENSNTLIFKNSGNNVLMMDSNGADGTIYFYDAGTLKGGIYASYDSGGSSFFAVAAAAGVNLLLDGNNVKIDGATHINGSTDIAGNLVVSGNITKGGSVSYIENTENYGTRLLYIVETPELLYYDRGIINLANGEATVNIDPIFLECIEPDTELTPWQIWVECYGENSVRVNEVGANYFKVKERNGGASSNKVIWRLEATRKNYAGIRLMEVLE